MTINLGVFVACLFIVVAVAVAVGYRFGRRAGYAVEQKLAAHFDAQHERFLEVSQSAFESLSAALASDRQHRHVGRERDISEAEGGRLRAVIREYEKRLGIPESESRAVIKPARDWSKEEL